MVSYYCESKQSDSELVWAGADRRARAGVCEKQIGSVNAGWLEIAVRGERVRIRSPLTAFGLKLGVYTNPRSQHPTCSHLIISRSLW